MAELAGERTGAMFSPPTIPLSVRRGLGRGQASFCDFATHCPILCWDGHTHTSLSIQTLVFYLTDSGATPP
eukprot:6212139-Pleurochrysis_carterae.AAC.1